MMVKLVMTDDDEDKNDGDVNLVHFHLDEARISIHLM